MELLRGWHNTQLGLLTDAEFRAWSKNTFMPKLQRVAEQQAIAFSDSFKRTFAIGNAPPFAIDLADLDEAGGIVNNPANLNPNNSGSLLTHRLALRGSYIDAHGEMSDIIEYQIFTVEQTAKQDAFWDAFIDLEAL